MTYRNIIETIQLDFPEYPVRLLMSYINMALFDFQRKTGLLRKYYQIPLNLNTATYSLPLDTERVLGVYCYNSASESLNNTIRYQIDSITREISFRDSFSKELQQVPSVVSSIKVKYEYKPQQLTEALLESSPEIPEEFQVAILEFVKSILYRHKSQMQLASFSNSIYKNMVLEAKKKANEGIDSPDYQIQGDIF